jgi:hypothetical protein
LQFKDDNSYTQIQNDTSNDLQFAIDAVCMCVLLVHSISTVSQPDIHLTPCAPLPLLSPYSHSIFPRGNSTTTAYKAMGAKGGKIVTVLPRNQAELGTRSDITIEMKLVPDDPSLQSQVKG